MCGLKIPHLDVSRVGEGSRTKADGEATVGGGLSRGGRGGDPGWAGRSSPGARPRRQGQECGLHGGLGRGLPSNSDDLWPRK